MNIVYRIQMLAVVLFSLFLVNCAKSGGGGAADPAGSCSAGTTYTATYGCLPSCGTGMVWINNQCIPAAQVTGAGIGAPGNIGAPGSNGFPLGQPPIGQQPNGQKNICQGSCAPGTVQMNNGQCLPQNTCDACYGFSDGWCIQGANARFYYTF
jgi:hypothetical protein